ncbi:MAG: hypothetical protein QOF28_2082, partial [Actinomycetota bacterium]|nr:hypothetical protein [Actinomycetota bacterium]
MVDGPTGPTGPDGGDDADEQEEPHPLGAAATLAVSRQSRKERRGPRAQGGGSRIGLSLGYRALVVLIALILLAIIPTFLSGLKKTPRNMIGISYGGGPFESAHFQKIVKPGSGLFFNGFFDPLYLYPSDQQNYIVSKNPRVGAIRGKDQIIAPTSDRVQLTYQVAMYFKLNTDLLRQFHEQLGLQYKAYTSGGWNNLLQDTFRQQIENALQQQTRRYSVADLYGNAKLLVQLQTQVQKTVSQKLISALGEPYFCAPTFKPGSRCESPNFIVKQIDIPSGVVTAFQNVRTSQIQIDVMKNQVIQRQEEAKGIAALNVELRIAGTNYVLLRAIEQGKINFWVLPSNSGVTIAGP